MARPPQRRKEPRREAERTPQRRKQPRRGAERTPPDRAKSARTNVERGGFARLPTEAPHPRASALHTLDARALVELLLDEDLRAARAARRQAPAIARAAERVAKTLAAGGRLVYVGAGTSGRLGVLDAAELPPTFGTDPARVVAVLAGGPAAVTRAVEGAEDSPRELVAAFDALAVDERDLVCAIAASGVTPFSRAALVEARRRGAASVFITCTPVRRRGDVAPDVLIHLAVGPEVIAGSTRLKAATATKLALAAISTSAMVRLGKVWRGRMVDLVATNAKLRDRARRIVAELGGVSTARAAKLLDEAKGRVKPALAAARLGVDVEEAARRLGAVDDRLEDLLD